MTAQRYIVEPKDAILGWAGAYFGTAFLEPCSALGILDRHGKIVGAAVYNCQEARNIELTVVAKHVLTPNVVRAIYRIAFDPDQYNARRISLTVRAKRADLVCKLQRWGYVIEGMKRDYYDDDHAIIMGMLREECRFWKPQAAEIAALAA